jgi:hypothetical protein
VVLEHGDKEAANHLADIQAILESAVFLHELLKPGVSLRGKAKGALGCQWLSGCDRPELIADTRVLEQLFEDLSWAAVYPSSDQIKCLREGGGHSHREECSCHSDQTLRSGSEASSR